MPEEEPEERSISDIAAEWRDTEDDVPEDEDDMLPDEAKEYVFDENDTQELTSDSDEF